MRVTNSDFYAYAYSDADGNTYDYAQCYTNGHSNGHTHA